MPHLRTTSEWVETLQNRSEQMLHQPIYTRISGAQPAMQILHTEFHWPFLNVRSVWAPKSNPQCCTLDTISIPTIREQGLHVTDVTWLNHHKLTMGLLHQQQFNHNICSKTAVIQIVEICPPKNGNYTFTIIKQWLIFIVEMFQVDPYHPC